MKLLLDEMLSPDIARQLGSKGHDVEAIAELRSQAPLSDPEVMDQARAEHRALVTNNLRDFRPLHADAIVPGGLGHFGMVFMSSHYRRTRGDIGRIVAALEVQLTRYPTDDDLRNAETWL